MKKIIVFLLSMTLICTCLASCGKQEQNKLKQTGGNGTALVSSSPDGEELKEDEVDKNSGEDILAPKNFNEVFYKGARFDNLDIIQEAAAQCGLDPQENFFEDLDNDGYSELLLRCETEGVPNTKLLLFAGDKAEGMKYLEDLSNYADLGNVSSFGTANIYGDDTRQILINISAGTGTVVCLLNYENEKVSEAISAGVGVGEVEAYVKDIDNDGVQEIIEETSFMDTQKHLHRTIYKWNREEFASSFEWVYQHPDAGFVHPSEPEKVVQNYIENMLLGVPKDETLKLVSSEDLLDSDLLAAFHVELVIYGFDYVIEKRELSSDKASYECEGLVFDLSKSNDKWIIKAINNI